MTGLNVLWREYSYWKSSSKLTNNFPSKKLNKSLIDFVGYIDIFNITDSLQSFCYDFFCDLSLSGTFCLCTVHHRFLFICIKRILNNKKIISLSLNDRQYLTAINTGRHNIIKLKAHKKSIHKTIIN